MLHELLFCLLGKPGSIFKQTQDNFYVEPSISFLNLSEKQLLNKFAHMGYNYHCIDSAITKELIKLDYQTFGEQPSVYRKAMAAGFRRILSQYVQKIMSIESTFFNNKHITIMSIKAQLSQYEVIFPSLLELIKKVQNCRGGKIIDIIQQTIQSSNIVVQQALKIVFNHCCKVLINQISGWILYGRIIDSGGQFFVHRVAEPTTKSKLPNRTQIEITDWDMYTLQVSMVSRTILSAQTAQKILFIGKGVKILRSLDRGSSLPRKVLQDKIKQMKIEQFDVINFDCLIQELRLSIAKQMIDIIMGQQKLMQQLVRINGYYLMKKGDFYELFLQQCKGIQNIVQRQRAQKKINEKHLQNTFMRLNNFSDVKTISFQLKSLGFMYIGFRQINHLCLVGNLHLLQAKTIRFNGLSALWHRTKQIVQSNFYTTFSFVFKRAQPRLVQTKVGAWKKSALNFVIHNSSEITLRVHDAPVSLQQLSEYICIRFGIQQNEKTFQSKPFVHIIYMNTKKRNKQQLLAEMVFAPKKQINFLDQKMTQASVNYSEGILKVIISKDGKDSGQSIFVKTEIKLAHYLNLQMGRAYVGFLPSLSESNLVVEIDRWEAVCKTPNHCGTYWSDLCLSYKVSWPTNLIITSDLLQNFSRIHKFLLPVRQVLLQIEKIWIGIPKNWQKTANNYTKIFQRKLCAYRWQLHQILNNLWGYFQSDIIDTNWNKLSEAVRKTDDFDELRGLINKYVKSIGIMFFFNVPNIQKLIHQIIRHGKDFIRFYNSFDRGQIERPEEDLQIMTGEFSDTIKNLFQLLKDWSKINNSNFLYHLIQRVQSSANPFVEIK